MAEVSQEQKAKKFKNLVLITGYLKENKLELVRSPSGVSTIKGSLLIALDCVHDYKVQFYVSATLANGQENKSYKSLVDLLPEKTSSIAGFLAADSGGEVALTEDTFKVAAQHSTKIWVRGHLEEYASKINEKETSIVTIRGNSAGIKSITDGFSFAPKAEFNVDMYIESIKPEMVYNEQTEEKEESGRLIVVGLLPDYKKCMHKIDFIVGKEQAEYVSENYEKGDTANFTGILNNLTITQVKKPEVSDGFTFDVGTSTSTVKFVSERIIKGRSAGSLVIKPDEPGAISVDMVKEGLALREQKITDNTINRAKRASAVPVAAAAASKKDTPTADSFVTSDLDEIF